ncbi:hypothetical protein KIW84_010320 [Lathyrus oleraceus]|uniref:Uncharacterized protein n=1 Tax=Pisum sativum TaxID=3888 RepID=A0A9D4YKW6_PEA|nr:hypothetical protein KIW84_010320 [Pisum sativum]
MRITSNLSAQQKQHNFLPGVLDWIWFISLTAPIISTLKYKIEIYVSNGESKYRFVLWNSECAAILGMTAEFMHNSMVENGEDDPMVYPDELEMLLNKKMAFRVKNQSKTEYAKLVPNKENLETSAQTLSASGENDPESIILMTPAKDVVIADKGEEVDFEASGATQLSETKPSKKLKVEPSS